MQTISSSYPLKELVKCWHDAGDTVAFVPTMGNLHQGHLRLVEVAARHASRVVLSIFVNPLQFNQGADFTAYPRTLAQDIERLSSQGIDALFCPDECSIYPEGMESSVKVVVPGLSDVLCGEFRPGHFEGVATVVAKLFNIVQPQVAVFGEKDFQQLQVIKKLVRDLNFPVAIIGVETEREETGLALSSRNQYLSSAERNTASLLYKVLQKVAVTVSERCRNKSSLRSDFLDLEQDALRKLEEAGFKPEYVQVRREDTLDIGNTSSSNLRVFAAAWLGKARLIDNISVPAG